VKASNNKLKLDKLVYLSMARSDISDNLDNKRTKDIFIFKNSKIKNKIRKHNSERHVNC